MKRLVICLTLLAFAVGMLVLPALHRIRGCDGHHSHQTDCPVCQLACVPLEDAPAPSLCVQTPFQPFMPAVPPLAPDFAAPFCDASRPRAPPACI